MIKFNAPNSLSGSALRKELNAAGIKISNDVDAVQIDENGDLLLDIAAKDKSAAQVVLDAHKGISQPVEISLAEKLSSIGLSIDELREALK